MPEIGGVPRGPAEVFLAGTKLPVGKPIVACICIVGLTVSLFHLYTAWFGFLQPYIQRLTCLSLLMVMGFLMFPLGRKSWHDELNKFFLIDLICILFIIFTEVYIAADFWGWCTRRMTDLDYIIGAGYTLILLEISRRTLGWGVLSVCILIIAVNFFAPYLPGILYGSSIPWRVLTNVLFMGDSGIFTIPVMILSAFMVLFLIFAALLAQSGASDFFLEASLGVAGRFTGGPAKVSVISSSITGMTMGSAAANVATTGSFTIPMMKRLGYKPHVAGAIEAVASTGGQFVPPVMGLVAFIMAHFLGVPYFRVCLAAIIPAILYYTGAFMTIHFHSTKLGFKGLPASEIPSLRRTLAWGWPILLPIVVLIFFLSRGFGVTICALFAITTLFIVSWFRKRTRFTPGKLFVALIEAARMAVPLAVGCGCAGILLGAFYISGLGDRLIILMMELSAGHMELALMLVALISLIMGMAMPTAAVYITMLVFAIPALLKMGCNPFAAHFFCFYYGVIGVITPPLAIAAFAGASIAESGMMQTAVTASRMALPIYFIPMFFAFNPAMLGFGSPGQIALALITGVMGVIAIAGALEGYLLRKTKWIERLLLLVAGACFLVPGAGTDLIGLTVIVPAFLLQKKIGYFKPLDKLARLRRRKDE